MKSRECEILTRGGWTLVEQSTSDEHGCNVELVRHDSYQNEFILLFDGKVMMDTSDYKSEKALSTVCFEKFKLSRDPHILIGGLGFGFTLEQVLLEAGSTSEVTVAELSSEIISWNQKYAPHLSNNCLEDSRVTVYNGDVLDLVTNSDKQWDIILLDVDNGTLQQLLSQNSSVYNTQGLSNFCQSLGNDGVLGVWSSGEDLQLLDNLVNAGLQVEVVNFMKEIRCKYIKGVYGPHIYVGIKS